jgi:xylan 1,4-beta-xylosidase
MADNHVPVDFVSSHGYADDTVANLFHTSEEISTDDRVCRAIGKVKDQIRASATPKLPLFWTEWNVQGERGSRDTLFVGPGLANTVRECDGLADMMSFWTFSDVFEEGGPIPQPFEGEFGLRASGGINKPSFYDFALLHQLGEQRIASSSKNVIATKRADGWLVIAAWNIVDPSAAPELPDGPHGATNEKAGTEGPTRMIELEVTGLAADAAVGISRVDATHGNVLPGYYAMGAPQNPTPAQVTQLNRETALPAPEVTHLKSGHLTLTLTPNTLVLVTVRP